MSEWSDWDDDEWAEFQEYKKSKNKKKFKNDNYYIREYKRTGRDPEGCYIATAVYGSYDCPEVWTLRRYRDYVLYEFFLGRLFIKAYYKLSPIVVKVFRNRMLFQKISKYYLDKFIYKLKEEGFKDTPYKDKNYR